MDRQRVQRSRWFRNAECRPGTQLRPETRRIIVIAPKAEDLSNQIKLSVDFRMACKQDSGSEAPGEFVPFFDCQLNARLNLKGFMVTSSHGNGQVCPMDGRSRLRDQWIKRLSSKCFRWLTKRRANFAM